MNSRIRKSLIVACILVLAGCSAKDNKQEGAAQSPAASATASASASLQAGETYHYDLKSVKMEPMPAWASKVEMSKKDPLYVSGTDLEGALSLDLTLAKKGDFLVASGKGVLWNGVRSVDFTITQTSILMTAQLSGGETLNYGALQAEAESPAKSFAFDLRWIPAAKQIELRLPNGVGMIVFGESAIMDKYPDEIAKLTKA